MIGQSCTYVQQHYGVPACIGRRVIAYGKPGIITDDFGHHIGITLDDDKKRWPNRYHPVDGIQYGEMADRLPRRPRRTNYDKFQYEDSGHSFEEWLAINMPVMQQRVHVSGSNREFRMVRYPRSDSWLRRKVGTHSDYGQYCEVRGEWAASKADAKASYKTALYKYLAQERANKKAGIY